MTTEPKPMRTFTVPATLPSVEEQREQMRRAGEQLDAVLNFPEVSHG